MTREITRLESDKEKQRLYDKCEKSENVFLMGVWLDINVCVGVLHHLISVFYGLLRNVKRIKMLMGFGHYYRICSCFRFLSIDFLDITN